MILIINLGSTSLKYELYNTVDNNLKKLCLVKAQLAINQKPDWVNIWNTVLIQLQQKGIRLESITSILHRVVFAPLDVLQSQDKNRFVINQQLLERLDQLMDFAPLHNPLSLGFIKYLKELNSDLQQFAVFDNYLYRDISEINSRLAVPKAWEKNYGLRRIGYHGLAHKSMLDQVTNLAQVTKVLSIQLGGGSSITAFEDGRALINSMGFGTSGGLIMSTRSGDIDAGSIIHLLNQPGITRTSLQYDLYHNSGLLVLAGKEYRGDMRLILGNQSDPDCQQALEMFVDSIVRYIGSYWLQFGGFEAITFGGGIGEGSDLIRSRIIKKLNILGVFLDANSNIQANETQNPKLISTKKSLCQVWVIPVNEAEVMLEVDS